MKPLARIFIAAAVVAAAPASAISEAEILAGIYGTVIGHADRCGYLIPRWLARRMGERVAATARSAAEEDRAIAMVRRTVEIVQAAPTMSCAEARAALRQAKRELR